MIRFSLNRILIALAVLAVVSTLTFWFSNVAVDPARAIAGEGASDTEIALVREQYGFDRPLHIQYGEWVARSLSGDLGHSYRQRRLVTEVIMERLPATMALGGAAFLLALLIAVPLGVLAALNPRSWIDRLSLGAMVVGMAVPSFWFGMLLVSAFSLTLGWLPISGGATIAHYILPVITLGYYASPEMMRLVRAGMLDVLRSDYIRTARAKGLRWHTIVGKHALRNAIVPVVSLGAVQLGRLLGGSVLVETVFALNGVGSLALQAIRDGDMPVVQAIITILAFSYILLTLLGDLLNALIDPRIRVS